jgi:hypothetical protein
MVRDHLQDLRRQTPGLAHFYNLVGGLDDYAHGWGTTFAGKVAMGNVAVGKGAVGQGGTQRGLAGLKTGLKLLES